MDSSSGGSPDTDHSWLAFSLSNSTFNPQTSHPPQQLCLFQPLQSSPGDVGDDNGGGASGGLSFLGGGSGGLLQVGLFPTAEAVTVAGGGVVYESSSAGFLGGFSTQQNQAQNISHGATANPHQQQQLAVVPLASVPSSSAHNTNNHSKKAAESFGQRTSIYRGVTRHRWTGRYEAHLWDNSCRREGQSRKGRQVYLGGYDKEEKAARAYDLAALKYWGPTTTTNFPMSDYEKELEEMKNMTRQEFVASLRRKSSGFSRGASIYRGVTRHHQHGRWQARIGRVAGNKDLYLGTFSTQEEAAEAYDIAAIKFRGLNAVTNFDISRYDVKSIMSSNLPVGGMSNKSRSASDHSVSDEVKVLEGVKPDLGHELPLCLPLITSPHQATDTGLNFSLASKPDPLTQNYLWPALGPPENTGPIGFGFGDGGNGVGEYMDQRIVGDGSGSGSGGGGNNGVNEGYNGYDGGVGGSSSSTTSGNNTSSWNNIVTPSLHTLQSPKPSLSVVQTPIFGIE